MLPMLRLMKVEEVIAVRDPLCSKRRRYQSATQHYSHTTPHLLYSIASAWSDK